MMATGASFQARNNSHVARARWRPCWSTLRALPTRIARNPVQPAVVCWPQRLRLQPAEQR
eukprot:10576223-Lingulodinium_polyedra.AAC.1